MPPARRTRGQSSAPAGKASGPAGKKQRGGGRSARRQEADRDEVDSGDSDEEEAAAHAALLSRNEEEEDALAAEPAEERRVRLAKDMLAAMDEAQARRSDGLSAGRDGVARGANEADAVAEALEEDALRRAGQWRVLVASKLRGLDQLQAATIRKLRGPRLTPTCVAVAPDESFAVCGCKDGSIVRWELPSGKSTKLASGRAGALYGEAAIEMKFQSARAAAAAASGGADDSDADDDDDDPTHVGSNGIRSAGTSTSAKGSAGASAAAAAVPAPSFFGGAPPTGHLSDVLSIAVSGDGRLIASGGQDHLMLLWDCRTNTVVHQFRGHRGPVRALARRRDGGAECTELYSAATDRTARVWDLEQRGYLETLYGHQEAITALDALTADMALSGAEDRTVRLWQVAEETQLLFANGHTASVDSVAMLHAEGFVSGAQDGSLCLWSSKRKRYTARVTNAHGMAPWGGPCWISALCAPPYSDVVISGSCDGQLRFWHADEENRKLDRIMSVPLTGVINGMALPPSGKFVACAVGQEHRLGRWFKVPEARNALYLVPLPEPLHAAPRLSVAGAAAKALGKARRLGDEDEDEDVERDDDEMDDDEDDS